MPRKGSQTPVLSRNTRPSANESSTLVRTPGTPLNRSRRRLVHDTRLRERDVRKIFDKYFDQSYKASRVSPMYNFKSSDPDLLQYKRQLTTVISRSESCARDVGTEEQDFNVVLEPIRNLRSPDSDSDAMLFAVLCSDADGEVKTVYKCVLCSINPQVVGHPENFVLLPLMLWRGSTSVNREVQNFLMRQFKCSIWAIALRPVDLEWLVVMYAGDEESPTNLQLTYKCPMVELSTIDFTLDSNSVIKMVRSVVDADATELTLEQVTDIMGIIKRHFKALTHIDLNYFSLQAVKTAAVDANTESNIKIKNPGKLLHVLGILTNIAESFIGQMSTN